MGWKRLSWGCLALATVLSGCDPNTDRTWWEETSDFVDRTSKVLARTPEFFASLEGPRELTLRGLRQKPRIISIWIDETTSAPVIDDFLVVESQVGQDAARGAAGASLRWLGESAATGNVFMLIFGVVTTPIAAGVGAIVGAGDSDAIIDRSDLADVEGAKDLVGAVSEHGNFAVALKMELTKKLMIGQHRLVTVELADEHSHETSQASDVIISVDIQIFALVGEVEDNPSASILAQGNATVIADWVNIGSYSCGWSYEGRTRNISEWRQNNAEAFINEIQHSAKLVSAMIINSLDDDLSNCPAPNDVPLPSLYRDVTPPFPEASANYNEALMDTVSIRECLATVDVSQSHSDSSREWTHIARHRTSLLNFPGSGSLVLRQVDACEKLKILEVVEASDWVKIRRVKYEEPIGIVHKDALATVENISAILSVTTNGYRLPGGSLVTKVHEGTKVQISLSGQYRGQTWYATDSLGQRLWIPKSSMNFGH